MLARAPTGRAVPGAVTPKIASGDAIMPRGAGASACSSLGGVFGQPEIEFGVQAVALGGCARARAVALATGYPAGGDVKVAEPCSCPDGGCCGAASLFGGGLGRMQRTGEGKEEQGKPVSPGPQWAGVACQCKGRWW